MTHDVNLLILANRQVHAQLMSRVRSAEARRVKEDRARWEERLAAWRQLRHDQALNAFKTYLHSDQVVQPAARAKLLGEIAEQQTSFHARREATLGSLGGLTPPALTEAAATEVRGQLEAQLSEEAEGASILFDLLEKADAELGAHVSKGLERLRARLSHFAAFDEDDLAATLALEAEPLVAMRRDEASELRARLRLAVRRQRVELHEQALHLCSRFEGAGKIFDGHLASITELYASYRQRLHDAREKHELADRELEARLDAELLAMRRAADIDELNGHLRTALALLEEIKGEYVAFLGAAGEINAEQPVRVQAELDALKATLVEFHELLPRDAYDDKLRLLIEGDAAAETEAAAAAAAAAAEGEGEGEGGGEEAEAAKAAREEAEAAAAKAAAEAADLQEEEDLVATFGFVYPAKMEAEIRLEEEYLGLEHKEEVLYADPHALTTGGGARYQMITGACAAELRAREAAAAPAPTEGDDAAAAGGAEPSAATDAPAGGEGQGAPSAIPADDEARERARWTAVAAEEVRAKHLLPVDFGDGLCAAPVIASAEAALALRTQLAAVCLTYHEVHAPKVYGRAVAETEALQAESTRELDERLLAHRPRAGQIELDMYQERDFELMAHRERFVRHQKALRQRRAALAAALEVELAAAEKAEADHLAKMEGLRRALSNPKNNHTPTLQRLQREAEAAHEVALKATAERFGELKRRAAESLAQVQQVNKDFAATWKPFEVGGTFNETEADRFAARLRALDDDAAAEAEAQRERLDAKLAEGQEGKAASLTQFGETYELNIEDIALMEGLNRRKGAATADMRIVLARSHAQAAAIDEATKKLGRLVGAKEGATDDDGAAAGGGGGAEAEGGGGDGDGADGGGGAAGDSDGDSDSGAALGGVAAEAGGARSLQVLKKVNLLRYLLLERAKMLACLQSDGVPNEPIAISLDEPADAAAAAAADEAAAKAAARGANARGTTASGEQKEGSLIEAVRAVREKHEAEMLTYCEAYYARKGEREITRPKHIPPTIEEHKAKLAAALDALLAKAEDERASAIRTLRFQLVAATRTLNLAGAAVFDDVAVGARHAAVKAVKAAAAAYTPLAADLQRKRGIHELSLKPSLRNPSAAAELAALEQAEAHRSQETTKAAAAHADAALAAETDHAALLRGRLVHLSALLLRLLDATVYPEDLTPADEPPEETHYELARKMRIEARAKAAAASEDPMAEGRPFPRHTWAGLALGEMTPAACGAAAPAADADADADADAGAAAPAVEAAAEASAELVANFTRPHRSVIAARDRVYASYRTAYIAAVLDVAKARDKATGDERQWALNWAKMVGFLKS